MPYAEELSLGLFSFMLIKAAAAAWIEVYGSPGIYESESC